MKGLVVLLLVLGCAACSEKNDVTGPTTAAVSIRGRVIDFFSRQTRPSASIEFRASGGSSAAAAATSDGAGQYAVTLPRGGEYLIFVNGNASGTAYVGGGGYLGDLIIHNGTCVARYGTVTDVEGRPLAKATVVIGALQAVSANDGWYSIEFGCPSSGLIVGNPVMNVSLAGYSSSSRSAGQGITGVQRLDAALQKLD
jgi:hypothetical protein